MITYSVPKSPNLVYFIQIGSMDGASKALGPFYDASGPELDTFRGRHPDDFIEQRPGVASENGVSHRQLEADLKWSPKKSVSTQLRGSSYGDRWVTYSRFEDGRFTSSSKYIYPYQLVSPTDYSDSDLTRVVSDRHVRRVSFNETFSNYTSRTTVYGFTVEDTIYSVGDLSRVQWTKTVQEYTFSPALTFSSSDQDLPVEGYRDRVFRGVYPESSKSKTVSTGYELKRWLKIPVEPGAQVAQVMSSLDSLPTLSRQYPDVKTPGELGQEAVETLDANSVNMIAFIKDIRRPWELIPKLKNLSKIKTHASNYLGYEYGILPTISDLKEIYEAVTKNHTPYFSREGYRVLTAGSSNSVSDSYGTITRTTRCKIAVRSGDSSFDSIGDSLHNIGVFPTFENVWDLVPYSFVLDWFLNVGDMLAEVDYRGRTARMDIVYSTTSTKTVFDFVIPLHLHDLGVDGTIRLTWYERNVSPTPPKTPLNFEGSNELPSHWLEAGALIVARTK